VTAIPGNSGASENESVMIDSSCVTAPLSDMGKYVAMVFASRARMFLLTISPSNKLVDVNVQSSEEGTIDAAVNVMLRTPQEKGVRAFLARHGLQVPDDSGIPPSFFPQLPVQWICDISPVPTAATAFSVLLPHLFNEIC